SYAACGIPYLIEGLVPGPEALVARTPEEHRRRGLDVRVRAEVVEVDTERARVRVRDVDGGEESWEGYDQLVVATGAVPVRPPWPGVDARGVHGVQTLTDGIEVRHDVESGEHDRAVVVGGGYIGL